MKEELLALISIHQMIICLLQAAKEEFMYLE
jgi:hypothetical protein